MESDENPFEDDVKEERRFVLTKHEAEFMKREVKDSVFTDLFRDKRYLLELYQALHPQDTGITKSDLSYVTCRTVLANTLYNDLGFWVRKKLIVLVEAQSTWSQAVVMRLFLYLASTYMQEPLYHECTLPFLYGNSAHEFPDAELYVIYTGKRRKDSPKYLTWRKHVSNNPHQKWDFAVEVIYDGAPGDIIDQYITFCNISDEKRRVGGYTKETMMDIINTCVERGVLVDYLRSKTLETMINLLRSPFEQEQIYRGMLEYREKLGEERGEKRGEERGEKRGEERGKRKNSIEVARNFLASGGVPIALIAQNTNLTVAEVEALARGEEIL